MKREIFHVLVHSHLAAEPDQSQETGARNIFSFSYIGERSQELGPLPTAPTHTSFLGHKQRAGYEVGQLGHEVALIWNVITHYATASAKIYFILFCYLP